LAKFGYTEEQVYLLLSCIPCEGRISGIVDVPNAVATLAIPLTIFDRDVRPPATMDKVEVGLAQRIRILNKNFCLSLKVGPYHLMLDCTKLNGFFLVILQPVKPNLKQMKLHTL